MEALKVLFTSSGRRVELIEIFKKEGFITYAADCDPTAPTLFTADKKFIVPRILEDPARYIDALMEIVKKENINVVIPLIDTELTTLAKAKDTFSQHHAVVLISEPNNVEIAFDKYRTYLFFKETGLLTPETRLVGEIMEKDEDLDKSFFPALLKPRFGSAGKGIMPCNDMDYILFLYSKGDLDDYVVQQKVSGTEITTDIFGDGQGNMISAVQRKRLKIRAGEVERGVTVKDNHLFDNALQFTRHYKPLGTVNIQCLFDKEKAFYIEINPRFGGGYPLAYQAGANFPGMIKKLLKGEKVTSGYSDYQEGLIMSRYDSAIYYKAE
ncbi:MAG: ATP-grasp domain-containing protein [Candidatus Aminicenantes bacterium]|nr:ATP-grasp domain-containing protein [Candidatus Aminicenantes bacterium]NIM83729.1 ATP-grasp domain-containing protein [Candidatus Aminicenantes bacterium]NIN23189.1 ATP-grasp domain-containing protein [Candidatus Aminicenantes bacterium]NIN46883.1 ATP-grasp domain-containing protein [Candidatus Aminicenantes bacterium]NIN89805.1 ATP-grasp domain-containing protein [Candidatus Aminicenantes bacterium]